jgi:AcrR family transcriptional regulator
MTPRAARTSTVIKDALEALLEEKPFSNISVQDIAERARINRATFYAHFSDKCALLEDTIREPYTDALSEYDPNVAPSIAALVETIALMTFAHIATRQKCIVDKEFDPQLERVLQDTLYDFLLPAVAEDGALVLSAAIVGAAMQWRSTGCKEPAPDVAQRLVTVLSSGVRLLQPA